MKGGGEAAGGSSTSHPPEGSAGESAGGPWEDSLDGNGRGSCRAVLGGLTGWEWAGELAGDPWEDGGLHEGRRGNRPDDVPDGSLLIHDGNDHGFP